MLVNQRAALCTDNNYCFKFLTQGHYGRNCGRTDLKCKDCGKAHNTLLHGADRQFPSSKPPGNNPYHILMIHAPSANSLRPMLLATVPLIVPNGKKGVLNPFGWSVVGKLPHCLVAGPSRRKVINAQSVQQDVSLCSLVEQFHLTECFGTDLSAPEAISEEDGCVLTVLESAVTFIGSGWQVALSLRSENIAFPNNSKQAVSRFYGMERRLSLPEKSHT